VTRVEAPGMVAISGALTPQTANKSREALSPRTRGAVGPPGGNAQPRRGVRRPLRSASAESTPNR
jgi:hypothetical protein